MPALTISEDIYQQLSERAAALHVTVEEFVKPALAQLVRTDGRPVEDDRAAKAEAEAFKAHLLGGPKIDNEFFDDIAFERDHDTGRTIEF
jgi:hypothetical protein